MEDQPARLEFLTFDAAFAQAWSAFRSGYGVLLGSVIIYGLITVFTSLIQSFAKSVNPALEIPVSIVLSLTINIPLAVGITYVGVRTVRGNSGGVADLFAAYARYLHVLAVQILVGLVMLSVAVPVAIVAALIGAVGSGAPSGGYSLAALAAVVIIALPVFIYLSIRLGFAGIICIDERRSVPAGIVEAISESWAITRPPRVWWTVFVIYCVVGLITLVCALLLVLPAIFFAAPFGVAVAGATYAGVLGDYAARLTVQST